MTTKLEALVQQRNELCDELSVSLELNRLFGTTNEALKLGAYQIKTGVFNPSVVYITVGSKESVKVFLITNSEFYRSPLRKAKIQVLNNHPYPEWKQATVITYEPTASQ